MNNPAKIDVSVLILFFNRPNQLQQVFDEVRKARPARLFLYQDGPRHEGDMAGVEACRKIVDNIDWECDVHRNYQTVNSGCDPSGFLAQKWAFSLTDKCIVLEDDCVPSQSFFPFCKEMLDRYEHDERIVLISGMNHEECTSYCPYDYFFATTFSIWGWASWRRVISQYDEHYTCLDDPYSRGRFSELIKERKYRKYYIRQCEENRKSGIAHFESILHIVMFFNNGLSIVPSRNMINNVGLTADSTHYAVQFDTLPRAIRRLFTMKRFEYTPPIQHPPYVIEDVEYKNTMFRIMGWGHPWLKIGRSFEELWLNIRHGDFSRITEAVRHRLGKWRKKGL